MAASSKSPIPKKRNFAEQRYDSLYDDEEGDVEEPLEGEDEERKFPPCQMEHKMRPPTIGVPSESKLKWHERKVKERQIKIFAISILFFKVVYTEYVSSQDISVEEHLDSGTAEPSPTRAVEVNHLDIYAVPGPKTNQQE